MGAAALLLGGTGTRGNAGLDGAADLESGAKHRTVQNRVGADCKTVPAPSDGCFVDYRVRVGASDVTRCAKRVIRECEKVDRRRACERQFRWCGDVRRRSRGVWGFRGFPSVLRFGELSFSSRLFAGRSTKQ